MLAGYNLANSPLVSLSNANIYIYIYRKVYLTVYSVLAFFVGHVYFLGQGIKSLFGRTAAAGAATTSAAAVRHHALFSHATFSL